MRRTIVACMTMLFLVSTHDGLRAQSEPARRELSLPLRDYLSLLERVEAREETAAARVEREEPVVAELTSQKASIVWPGDESDFADVTTRFEVLLQGYPARPVLLPLAGLASRARIEPERGASLRMTPRGLELVASEPGRYLVSVTSRARIEQNLGTKSLRVAPLFAAVGEIELDLPEALLYRARGAVSFRDVVSDGRRVVGFTLPRGAGATLEVRRDVDGDEGAKLLADVAMATVVELSEDGAVRHDILRYRVSRGALSRFVLTLPDGLALTRLVTDEGEAPLLVEDSVLTVERKEKLTKVGYLVLTSQPAEIGSISLEMIKMELPVRERFLILSSTIASEVDPLPATSFRRVDISDVPETILDAAGVDTHAAWRIRDTSNRLMLRVDAWPPTTSIETTIRERRSLTLLTAEGTLVHRDTFTVRTSRTTFELELPLGSKLWSSRVNGTWVRSVERDGSVLVPLGFGSNGDEVIELVSVSERTVPERRTRIELDLGTVSAPVLQHTWRLLLPEHNKYRYHSGELKPAPARARRAPILMGVDHSAPAYDSTALGRGGSSGIRARVVDMDGGVLPGATATLENIDTGWRAVAVTDVEGRVWFASLSSGRYSLVAELTGFAPRRYEDFRLESGVTPAYLIPLSVATVSETVTVTGQTPLLETANASIATTIQGRDRRARSSTSASRFDESAPYRSEARALSAGLTGGVKPVPVTIPEQGKLIVLTAALPPASVSVLLDVKPN